MLITNFQDVRQKSAKQNLETMSKCQCLKTTIIYIKYNSSKIKYFIFLGLNAFSTTMHVDFYYVHISKILLNLFLLIRVKALLYINI